MIVVRGSNAITTTYFKFNFFSHESEKEKENNLILWSSPKIIIVMDKNNYYEQK